MSFPGPSSEAYLIIMSFSGPSLKAYLIIMSFSGPSLEAYLIMSRLPLVDLYLTISNEPTLDQCPVYAFQLCVKDDIYLKVDILDCDQGVIRKKDCSQIKSKSICLRGPELSICAFIQLYK